MAKSKLKEKEIAKSEKRPRASALVESLSSTKPSASESQDTVRARAQYWRDEIESLKRASFATVEEAVQSVVAKALLRQGGIADPGLQKALSEMMLSDPEIVETIKANLQIK